MKILAAAGDAGGARALQSVIHHLRKEGVKIECRAYAAAEQIWQTEGFSPRTDLMREIKSFDKILLGTTVSREQYELEIISQANALKISSVSVLDFWTNYRKRFTTSGGELILPTAIAVMDESARKEMIEVGFPSEILQITGQPAFDELADYLVTEEKDFSARQKIEILYVSQPLSQLYSRDSLGFDEYEALRDVIAELNAVLEKHKTHGVLKIKLHPREADRNYDLPHVNFKYLKVLTANAFDNPRRAVQNSDFVIGMNSILLMEACFLGKPVISYQPNLRLSDPLPSNEYGWSKAVYNRLDLSAAFESELFDEWTRRRRGEILQTVPRKFNAAQKVANLILNI